MLGRLAIGIIFEHGRFDADAGALTYTVLVAYVLALPAYVGCEILSRGLLALQDARTPLLANTAQVAGRIAIMAVLIGRIGVLAVPAAFATMAVVESVLLAATLLILIKIRRRAAPRVQARGAVPGRLQVQIPAIHHNVSPGGRHIQVPAIPDLE